MNLFNNGVNGEAALAKGLKLVDIAPGRLADGFALMASEKFAELLNRGSCVA